MQQHRQTGPIVTNSKRVLQRKGITPTRLIRRVRRSRIKQTRVHNSPKVTRRLIRRHSGLFNPFRVRRLRTSTRLPRRLSRNRTTTMLTSQMFPKRRGRHRLPIPRIISMLHRPTTTILLVTGRQKRNTHHILIPNRRRQSPISRQRRVLRHGRNKTCSRPLSTRNSRVTRHLTHVVHKRFLRTTSKRRLVTTLAHPLLRNTLGRPVRERLHIPSRRSRHFHTLQNRPTNRNTQRMSRLLHHNRRAICLLLARTPFTTRRTKGRKLKSTNLHDSVRGHQLPTLYNLRTTLLVIAVYGATDSKTSTRVHGTTHYPTVSAR